MLLRKRRKPFLNKTWEWGTKSTLKVKLVFDLKKKARLRRNQVVLLRKAFTCFYFPVHLKHRDPLAERRLLSWQMPGYGAEKGSMICSPRDTVSEIFPACFLHPNLCLLCFPNLKGIPRRNSNLEIISSLIPPAPFSEQVIWSCLWNNL